MSEQVDEQPQEADLRSLSEKLATFTATLTPRERAILMSVVQAGTARDGDVQGYGWWDSLSSAGWFDALSRSMTWVAIGQGMIVDEQVLEYLHSQGEDQRTPEATPALDVTALPSSPPRPAGAS